MPSLPVSSSRRSARRLPRRHRGFTLMEILIALAILGLLVGLGIATLGNTFEGARNDTASIYVNSSLKVPLQTYQIRMGNYPTTAEGLQALLTAPANKADRWGINPYIEGNSIPLDPWGEPYQYASPGTHNKNGYDVWSKGKDLQSGTADDIGNWSKVPTETK